MRAKYVISILFALAIIISSASAYAFFQKKEEKILKNDVVFNLKQKELPTPYNKQDIFTAEIGFEKDKEPLYFLYGNYQMKDDIISVDGTVNSGDFNGQFYGIFRGKNYFEIILTIEDKKQSLSGEYKYEKNKEDFQGIWGSEVECFEFVYPISYMMPDDTIITGDSEKEIDLAIKEWYKAHPDVKEKPVLQYPVDIKFKDGTIKTINNDEEMKNAYEDCPDKEWGWINGTFKGGDNPRNRFERFPITIRRLKMSIFKGLFLRALLNI